MSHWLRLVLSLLLVVSLPLACSQDDSSEKDTSSAGMEKEDEVAEEAEDLPPDSPYKTIEIDLNNIPASVLVMMTTSMGNIVLELDNEKAPITVKNFLEYAKAGHYDGTIFHRVMSTFMIQGGGYSQKLYDNPSMRPLTTRATIQNEATNGLKNLNGTIAMARTNAIHSATSQIFINVKDNGTLDHKNEQQYGYAVFGKVVEGMDVVDAIKESQVAPRRPHQHLPVTPIFILSVKAVEKKN